MSRIPFLNSYIDAVTMEQTIAIASRHIEERTPVQHVVLNAGKVVQMHMDAELRDIVNDCKLINADGMAVVWAARLLGYAIPERVTGIDLMFALMELASRSGWPVYLLGAKAEVLSSVVENVLERFPELAIAGYHHGYFRPAEEEEVVRAIGASGANLLFVAFSSPKKEKFIAAHMNRLNVPFCMGVGGSFDIIAGVSRRAPPWMQRAGLEWLYRLLQEPRRMWRRYLLGNTRFIQLVIRAKWKQIRRTVS